MIVTNQDEPTTGLDARSALVVMRSVKKIAKAGRSVICTIHQPSAAIFDMYGPPTSLIDTNVTGGIPQ